MATKSIQENTNKESKAKKINAKEKLIISLT